MGEAQLHKCRKATAQTCIRNSCPFLAGPEETIRSVYRKSFSHHNCWNRDISARPKATVDVHRTVYSELWLADVSRGVDAWASPQSLSPQKVFCLCSPFCPSFPFYQCYNIQQYTKGVPCCNRTIAKSTVQTLFNKWGLYNITNAIHSYELLYLTGQRFLPCLHKDLPFNINMRLHNVTSFST